MKLNYKTKGRVICLFFVLAILESCSNDEKIVTNRTEGNAIGTTYHVSYLGNKIKNLSQKIDSITFAVNHGLSTYQVNSMVTAFNSNSDSIWKIPSEFAHFSDDMQHFIEMLSLSKTITQETLGAFDPSAAALFEVYNKAKKDGVFMKDSDVEECKMHQGMDKIQFNDKGNPFKLDSLVSVNFNAIAKGYLVDIIALYLETNGVTNFMVEVGGELRVKGKNEEGTFWKVGVNTPIINANPSDFFTVLELENVSLATSGNYQNFYEVNGDIIGHTLDPVLHDYCAVADAYATACMVLGLDEATKLIKANKSLSAYFIYDDGTSLKGVYVE
jgi:FAD:protein FMN transferase